MRRITGTNKITVGDVATFPVYTVNKNQTVEEAAKEMDLRGIGSIIVVNSSNNPVGMITERDIVVKVVARGLDPKKVTVGEVMSSPLITIDYNKDLERALDTMRLHKVHKLGVMKNDKLVGIITERDIVLAVPAILETYYSKISSSIPPTNKIEYYEGYCEDCGQWSERLVAYQGKYICEDCLSSYGVSVEELEQ